MQTLPHLDDHVNQPHRQLEIGHLSGCGNASKHGLRALLGGLPAERGATVEPGAALIKVLRTSRRGNASEHGLRALLGGSLLRGGRLNQVLRT